MSYGGWQQWDQIPDIPQHWCQFYSMLSKQQAYLSMCLHVIGTT